MHVFVGAKKKEREYVNKAYEKTVEQFPNWQEEFIWGLIEHRPYMRSIGNKAMLCHDDGDKEGAAKIYRELLACNPYDNQGIRFLCAALYAGKSGQYVDDLTDEGNKKQDWSTLDGLLEEQNDIHKFWEEPDIE